MSKFFSKLSQNFTAILDNDNEYQDVLFEIGDGVQMKEFRAHAVILSYRSPYFRRHFSVKKDLFRMKFQNISPEIFEISLKYIYGGFLSLNGYNNISDIIKLLLVADEFHLQELLDYLQKYLIDEKSEWIDQNFDLVHRTSLKSICFTELQQYCINLMSFYPSKIFKSLDFTSLDEKSLLPLLKKSELQMEEVDIWSSVLKWGHARNSTLMPDPSNWTDDEFRLMETTLSNVLSHIRFFSLSSKEFLDQVIPYQKLLKPKLYQDLLKYFLDPDSKPPKNNYLAPRYYGKFDTNIINIDIVSLISRWVDNVKHERKFSVREKLYLPYEFNLLLRGSRDGFTPKKFHEICDGKENTVSFIKVKGTDEIYGGFNPLKWATDGDWLTTEESFIFSFKCNSFGLKDAIYSKIRQKDKKYACRLAKCDGPGFGEDIKIYGDPNKSFENVYCQHNYYEKSIRNTKDNITIDDYEVFQIKKIK